MIKRIYIDTNVLIDLVEERKPFYNDISIIISIAQKMSLELVVSSLSFATSHYVISKFGKSKQALELLKRVKVVFESVDFSNEILDQGLNSKFADFEDSLHYYSALINNCDLILTRNTKDFGQSTIPVMTPQEYLNLLKN